MRWSVRAGRLQHERGGNAQEERRRERGEENRRAGGREPVEREARRLGALGLVGRVGHPAAVDGVDFDRMLAVDHAVEARDFDRRRQHRVWRRRDVLGAIDRGARRSAIEERLGRAGSPHGHEDREEDPRHPRAHEVGARDRRRRRPRRRHGAGRVREVPHFGRLPPRAEEREAAERHQAAHDVHELWPDVVAPQELDDRERAAAHEHRRPRAAQPAPAAHRDDQPGRHEERHERQLASGHRARADRVRCR